MTSPINMAFMKLSRRAELYDRAHLVSTFVNVGPLFTLISVRDHQILYGRRGTGKTHCLYYLASSVESSGDIVITIDMRTIGSTGGIYSDYSLPLPERATRLLADTLGNIHDAILKYVLEHDNTLDLSRLGPILDHFADAITEISVAGTVEREETVGESRNSRDNAEVKVAVNLSKPETNMSMGVVEEHNLTQEHRVARQGVERHRIHFGRTQRALSQIMELLSPMRVWLLLDEWSEVPQDLQPYLADLLRRTVFPVPSITVKIAAIEQRCQFRIATGDTGYIGIEVGADAATSLNLDEFMVFDNDSDRAKAFFAELIFKHVRPLLPLDLQGVPQSASDLIKQAFTQESAFDEFVRASEGVPRDAINIIGMSAQRADNKLISVPEIRVASKVWYNRAKEAAVLAKPQAHNLLRWVIDEVIGHRRARAFLLRSDIRDELIEFLFDARVLHVVKQSVSAHDQPGVRYSVYSIDYGCYVDLINTSRAPQGLFAVDTESGIEYIEVPINDYRSIRRAILSLDEFYELYRTTA